MALWVAREVLGVDAAEVRSAWLEKAPNCMFAGDGCRDATQLPGLLRSLFFSYRRAEAEQRQRCQAIAAGLRHSVVVRGGVAHSFGAASSGQLGRGSPALQVHPMPTPIHIGMPITMVACGGDHTLLVASTGEVWAFGRNAEGQLGTGNDRDVTRPSVMPVPPAFQAACGADHSLILGRDGSVWACGRGVEGQLGSEPPGGGERATVPFPVASLPPLMQFVACGADHSVVLDGSGHALAFGENSKGQLGIGQRPAVTAVDSASQAGQFHRTPTRMVLPPGVFVISADCGGTHTLLMTDDGRVYGCGGNDQGQLGAGSSQERWAPAPVLITQNSRPQTAPGAASASTGADPSSSSCCRARRVSCGFSHSLLLSPVGAVWVLGGRGGAAASAEAAIPANSGLATPSWRVRGYLEHMPADDVVAGGGHALCISNENVFSFGVGSSGQLGDGSERPHSPTPRQVIV